MDVEHMKPFAIQTARTLDMMLGIKLTENEVETKSSTDGTYDVSAILGITGRGAGGVVLSFPEDVACKIASIMLDEEKTEVDMDVTDALGELLNIISGNALRDLVKHGYKGLSVSIPNVVIGKHRTVWPSRDMPCLMTRFFTSDIGPFSLEVNIRQG